MRADLRPLLDHDHAGLGRELPELYRGGEPSRSRADDHHVELHRLAGGQFLRTHRRLLGEACLAVPGTISNVTVATNRERSTVPFRAAPSGRIPKFVRTGGTFGNELRNPRTTMQLYDSSAPLNPKFAIAFAARCARTSGSGH